ncbi:MAG: hypothetical protein AAB601_01310 [Patescibacteria group bacterium]
MYMVIDRITVREIFDSRGEPTIEVGVVSGSEASYAAIPSGKSRGAREATVVPFTQACATVSDLLAREIVGKRFDTIGALDRALIAQDGTKTKEVIGGNLMLGVSVAHARNLAASRGVPLWQVIRDEFFSEREPVRPPLIFSNLINGGSHAHNNLAFQEYLIVARTDSSITETVRDLVRFYHTLGEHLKDKYRIREIPIGDEEGYSLDFKTNLEPLSLMDELVGTQGYHKNFSLGIDAAASSFWSGTSYRFEGHERSTDDLLRIYRTYLAGLPTLISIEDPFAETDADGFAKLQAAFPKLIVVGDDLTVTDPALIETHARAQRIRGVIIKPNQIGTLSETCAAITAARRHGLQCIISHRSGETEDTLIIHVARASSAEGVKIGAPLNERMVKFDELIRVYEPSEKSYFV